MREVALAGGWQQPCDTAGDIPCSGRSPIVVLSYIWIIKIGDLSEKEWRMNRGGEPAACSAQTASVGDDGPSSVIGANALQRPSCRRYFVLRD